MPIILVPVDFSDATERLLAEAERFAKAFNAEVELLHVLPQATGSTTVGSQAAFGEASREERAEEHRALQRLAKQLETKGIKTTTRLLAGTPGTEIVAERRRTEADMILLGTHGHGDLRHLLLGSVSTSVIREAQVPVVMVPIRGR